MRGHSQRNILFHLLELSSTSSHFSPDGIRLWNALPQQLVDSTSSDCFRGQVQSIPAPLIAVSVLTHLSLVFLFLHYTYPAPNKHTVREYANGGLYFKDNRTGHFVKVSLWYASLLTNTRFRFLYYLE